MESQRPTERQLARIDARQSKRAKRALSSADYRYEARGDAICAVLFAGVFGLFASENRLPAMEVISGVLAPVFAASSFINYKKSKG